MRPLTTVAELAVNKPLERTNGSYGPTCKQHNQQDNNNKFMKKMESKKRAYTPPEMMVYPMQEDNLLQAVNGQHEHIGQGGRFGNAKRGSYEEWEEASPNPSEGGENTQPSYNMWEE